MSNHPFVVAKLISGETLMATFIEEDEKYIKMDKPVSIKTYITEDLEKEAITASPYCPFSESSIVIIEKAHILYINKLHKVFETHYKTFIRAYADASVPIEKLEKLNELDNSNEPLTVNEAEERLKFIQSLMEDDTLPPNSFVAKGNNTKH